MITADVRKKSRGPSKSSESSNNFCTSAFVLQTVRIWVELGKLSALDFFLLNLTTFIQNHVESQVQKRGSSLLLSNMAAAEAAFLKMTQKAASNILTTMYFATSCIKKPFSKRGHFTRMKYEISSLTQEEVSGKAIVCPMHN